MSPEPEEYIIFANVLIIFYLNMKLIRNKIGFLILCPVSMQCERNSNHKNMVKYKVFFFNLIYHFRITSLFPKLLMTKTKF